MVIIAGTLTPLLSDTFRASEIGSIDEKNETIVIKSSLQQYFKISGNVKRRIDDITITNP
jgi:hypothetical protein